MKCSDVLANIGWNEIAACLALQDDDVQGKFFNAYGKELKHACETHYRFEIQLHYIVTHLDKNGKDAVEVLAFKEEQ